MYNTKALQLPIKNKTAEDYILSDQLALMQVPPGGTEFFIF